MLSGAGVGLHSRAAGCTTKLCKARRGGCKVQEASCTGLFHKCFFFHWEEDLKSSSTTKKITIFKKIQIYYIFEVQVKVDGSIMMRKQEGLRAYKMEDKNRKTLHIFCKANIQSTTELLSNVD